MRNAMLAVERLEDRRMLAAGDLDTTFNSGGVVPGILLGQFAPHGVAVADNQPVETVVQSDGKIVIAMGVLPPGGGSDHDVVVARFNADGTVDTTFGTAGFTQFDFATGQSRVRDLAIDGLGRIIVVGAGPVVTFNFAVARLTSAGVLDTSFDGDGKATTSFGVGVSAEANAVAIDSSNRIVAAGWAGTTLTSRNFALVRYNANGSLDTTFDVDGLVTTDFVGLRDEAQDVAIQGDGQIVVAGSARATAGLEDFALARYNAIDGSLDLSFDGDGKATTHLIVPTASSSQDQASSLALQADGKIVVSGSSVTEIGLTTTREFTMMRYNANGSLDTTFNPTPAPALSSQPGTLRIHFQQFDFAEGVAIQPDGKYITAGWVGSALSGNNNTIGLARILNGDPIQPDGTPDNTFSGDGLLQTSFTPFYDTMTADVDFVRVFDVTMQPDGKILVTGSSKGTAAGANVEYFIARYESGLANHTISGAASVAEGSTYTLNLATGDPTTSQWTINWGDGPAQVVPGNPLSVTHVYADGANNYMISATVTNSSGTFPAADTVALAVNNVAPTLAISGAASVNEGALYTLNLSSVDPGADTISQWTIDWGDGPAEVVLGNPASATHTYADGASSYVISATATDEDGTHTAGNTVAVTVDNIAPALAISGAASVNEGGVYTLNLSSSDPGTDTVAQWTIDWGDGPAEVVSGNPSSVTHTYADGLNNYVISATATDEDGTHAAGNTVAVTVNDVVPTLAIAGAAIVAEGSVYTLNLSSSDPGADTIASWTIDWGDGPAEVVSGNPASVTHTYADGLNNYVISATATNEDGTFAAGSTIAVTVDNVAPTANASGPYQTFDDTPITLNGTATDPAGAADPLTFEWDLDGDNIFGETGAGATRGDEVGANPTYNPIGLPTSTQTVSLRVSDGDGGVTTVTTTVDVLGEGTVLIGGALYVVGSNTANDIVIITKAGSDIKVIASFNPTNPMSFNESLVTEIRVRTRGGHDIVVTTPNVTKPMTIDGGNGNDLLTGGGGRNVIHGGAGQDILYGAGGDDVLLGGADNDDLFGGSGNDVLVGGDGSDILNGGTGRDLLIGSQDEDFLQGGGDEDILIGGYTSHDNNVTALDAIMAIWGSAASFNSRVATLTGSGGMLEAGVAVFDDDDWDVIVGGSGRDLIFGDTNPWDGALDLIALQVLQDVLVPVN